MATTSTAPRPTAQPTTAPVEPLSTRTNINKRARNASSTPSPKKSDLVAPLNRKVAPLRRHKFTAKTQQQSGSSQPSSEASGPSASTLPTSPAPADPTSTSSATLIAQIDSYRQNLLLFQEFLNKNTPYEGEEQWGNLRTAVNLAVSLSSHTYFPPTATAPTSSSAPSAATSSPKKTSMPPPTRPSSSPAAEQLRTKRVKSNREHIPAERAAVLGKRSADGEISYEQERSLKKNRHQFEQEGDPPIEYEDTDDGLDDWEPKKWTESELASDDEGHYQEWWTPKRKIEDEVLSWTPVKKQKTKVGKDAGKEIESVKRRADRDSEDDEHDFRTPAKRMKRYGQEIGVKTEVKIYKRKVVEVAGRDSTPYSHKKRRVRSESPQVVPGEWPEPI